MSPSDRSSGREERVDEAIASYLEQAANGSPPEREAFLGLYPDLADELRSFLDDHARFSRVAGRPVMPPTEGATLDAREPRLADPTPGTVKYFGDYQLIGEIARGAMGVVYKARQVSLNRPVALKMILAGQLASPGEVARFRREAEAAANLDHPGILPVYEVGEHEGQHYYAMKLVEGGSLAAKIPDLVGQPRPAATLLARVCRAVHHAHQHGILHRDLKPGNVLVDPEGTPYVSDFGLTRRMEGDSRVTQSGAIVGTPSYMAPEQAAAKKDLSIAVDVYALGAILYEVLTGRPPFRADTPLDTLLQVMDREPPRPRSLRPGADPDLETIALKCLQKEPAKRYGSAEALAEDLERWLGGEPILARRSSSGERLVKWARRRPAVASLLACLAAVVLGGVFALTALWLRAERERVEAVTQRRDAESAREEAAENARRASAEAANARLRLYDLTVNQAQSAWREANVRRAIGLLNEQVPGGDGPDLRGFEWHYLWRLCHNARLTRHLGDNVVECVAFSPDGKRVGAVGRFGVLKVWDASTGAVVFAARDEADWVRRLAFSPDGRTVATPSGRSVKVRDAVTGQVVRTLTGHKGRVNAVAYSPDGQWLASCDDAATTVVWNASDGSVAATLGGHSAEVVDLAFFPDGGTLASVSGPGVVRVWEIPGGRELRSFHGRVVAPVSMAVSPDGSKIVLTGRKLAVPPVGGVLIADALTGRELSWYPAPTNDVGAATFSPDGRLLAVTGDDNAVRLLEVAGGKEVRRFRTRGRWNTRAVFSPDGSSLAAGGYDDTVEVWDVGRDQECLTRGGIFPRGSFYALNADSGQVVEFALSSVGLAIFDVTTGQRLVRLQGVDSPWSAVNTVSPLVAFAPDGRQVAGGSADGTVRIWDTKTGALLRELEGIPNTGVTALAYSRVGTRLAAAGAEQVCVWELPSGRSVASLKGDLAEVNGLAFSPDGRQLVTGSGQRTILLWDVERGTVVRTLSKVKGYGNFPSQVLFSPDGLRIVAATGSDSVEVFDADSGKELFSLAGHTAKVFQIALSPDGKRLASAADDGTVRVWNLVTGRELLRLNASLRTPSSVGPPGILAFSTDCRSLTAVGKEGTVFVWEASPPAPEGDK
jgi:WD40 repeat protein